MTDYPISKVLKMMPYGFYAISSRDGEEVNIMVANWLTQASFEPQLVALGLQKTSHTYGLIKQGQVFAVNIFRKEDQEAIKPFTKSRAKNPDKVKNAKFSPGPETGCPVLDEAAAFIECKVVAKFETGGDHDIMLGEVVGAGINKPGEANDSLTLPHIGWSYAG
ncbi:MAG: flavin reductase family protein [Chloroflexi bacterium]|nr:flavin reductase family protein [Chloroflexota bacterium]